MKKSLLASIIGLACCAVPLHSACANTFTTVDWNPLTSVESSIFKLQQDIDQSSKALIDQADLAQLSCLNGVAAPLIHIQGIATREKELLQLATIMVYPVDEQKIKQEMTLDITSDLDLLKVYKEQAKIAGKLCPDSPKTGEYAGKIADLDDELASDLHLIQPRLK